MTARPVIGSLGELLVEFVCTETDGRNLRPSVYRGPFPSGAPGIFIDQVALAGARAVFAGAVIPQLVHMPFAARLAILPLIVEERRIETAAVEVHRV